MQSGLAVSGHDACRTGLFTDWFPCHVAGIGNLRHVGMARSASGIDMGMRNLVFLVMAAGFLSKAGAIPFHVWLPRAHPAATSHVSAVVSGVMIQLGVYGLLRISFEWLGSAPAWQGAASVIVGGARALRGV